MIVLDDQGGGVMQLLDNTVGTLRKETHGHIPIILKDMEIEPKVFGAQNSASQTMHIISNKNKGAVWGNYRIRIEGTIGGAPWSYEDGPGEQTGVIYFEDADLGGFNWSHGNMSCDCNRAKFVNPLQKTNVYPCGNYIRIQRIIPIDRPDLPVLELNEPVETIDEFVALLEQPSLPTFGLQANIIDRSHLSGGNGLGVKEEEAPTLTKADRHAVCYDTTQVTSPVNGSNPQTGDPCHPLSKTAHAPLLVEGGCLTPNLPQRVRIHGSNGVSPTLSAEKGRGHNTHTVVAPMGNDRTSETLVKSNNQWTGLRTGIAQQSEVMVRRPTPMECERLQGFPDGYTDIPVYEIRKGGKKYKPAADSARYAALGNSMTTNVMHWLGSRIASVQDTLDTIDIL